MKASYPLALSALLFLSACGTFDVSVQPLPSPLPTSTVEIPTNTAPVVTPTEPIIPTATLELPSPTVALPAATQVPPAAPTSTPGEQTVRIFLIALEDNGQSGEFVGCGDSAVPVTVTIPHTQGVLRAALEKLLSARQQFYGESGLYNALYQSDLQVAGVTIEQGKAIIHLTGSIMLGGTCDAPRLQAQIEQTALQFSTVTDVDVFINDKPIEEALSTK
ncbi:MAG: GerMN domain-containing protein [Anaerolineales bacterium]